ncbi:hypothetical protein MRB53_009625 [Persea americana]|uniref:Uncharacterized protein n=1 Tax=Persea americana TaxID=3435 RepID=A0ACC2LQ85_PERAE|nr:hypothetical protein MRB53_009625 [Persea americana]
MPFLRFRRVESPSTRLCEFSFFSGSGIFWLALMAKPTFCNCLLLPESMFLRFTINCGSLQLVFSSKNHRSPSGSLFQSSSSAISNAHASAALFSSALLPWFFSEPGAQY